MSRDLAPLLTTPTSALPLAPPASAARAAAAPQLAGVASRAGMAPGRLEALLAREADIGFDAAAQSVFYACSGLAAASARGRGHAHTHTHAGGTTVVGSSRAAAPAAVRLLAGGAAADASAARRRAGVAAYARRPPRPPAGGSGGGGGATIELGPGPSATPGGPDPEDLSLAFKLHSRPGAPKRILLDFKGAPRGAAGGGGQGGGGGGQGAGAGPDCTGRSPAAWPMPGTPAAPFATRTLLTLPALSPKPPRPHHPQERVEPCLWPPHHQGARLQPR
jgi:hypothetical protein